MHIERSYSEVEISKVVASFDGNKAPDPDGFSLMLFKKGWKFLKGDIMAMMLQFSANATLPIGFNSSFIVLIPKLHGP